MRLDPVFEARPWYLTDGLLHYVGVHSQSTLGAIWGACFAVNRDFARASGIRFSTRLGRLRRGLQSGDDSSYVKQVGLSGGRLVFLAETAALHSVSGEKCSLRYLMRRAC